MLEGDRIGHREKKKGYMNVFLILNVYRATVV